MKEVSRKLFSSELSIGAAHDTRMIGGRRGTGTMASEGERRLPTINVINSLRGANVERVVVGPPRRQVDMLDACDVNIDARVMRGWKA